MPITHRNRSLRQAAVVSLSTVVLGGMVCAGPAAWGTTQPAADAVNKLPPGGPDSLVAVAVVPHRSDLWALGSGGSDGNAAYSLGRRHDGHWHRVKSPGIGGRYGTLSALAAGSAGTVWLGGGKQLKDSEGGIQEIPVIWRWNGKRFVTAKLPKLDNGADGVGSISASSASNAWAVGTIYLKAGGPVALHWNGKTWSAVPAGPTYVSTSGPHSTWGIGGGAGGDDLLRWSQGAWADVGATPAGVMLQSIAATSPKLVYAVGSVENTTTGKSRPVVMRYNGKKWAEAPLAKHLPSVGLTKVAVHGHVAWAIGTRETAGDARIPVILRSGGGGWKLQHAAERNFGPVSIAAASTKRVYVAGYYYNYNTMFGRSFLYAYNGHSWKGVPSRF